MNDLLVWFDSKTGNEMENQDKFIEEVREISNKYGFDFYTSGNPESFKKVLSFITFEPECEQDKKKSKNEELVELLKRGWISNFKACYLLKTAHADRRIRDIRQKPIIGYDLEEMERIEKIENKTITYKEYRLVENKSNKSVAK